MAAASVVGSLAILERTRIGKGMARRPEALLMQSSKGEPLSNGMHSWRGLRAEERLRWRVRKTLELEGRDWMAAARVRGACIKVLTSMIGNGTARRPAGLLIQSSNGEPLSKGMHSWRGARMWVSGELGGAGRAMTDTRRVVRVMVRVRRRMVEMFISSGV